MQGRSSMARHVPCNIQPAAAGPAAARWAI